MTLVYRFVEHGPLMPYSWHIPNRKSTPRCLDGAFNAWVARSAHVRMSAPLQHLVSAYLVWVFLNALKLSLHLGMGASRSSFQALPNRAAKIFLLGHSGPPLKVQRYFALSKLAPPLSTLPVPPRPTLR